MKTTSTGCEGHLRQPDPERPAAGVGGSLEQAADGDDALLRRVDALLRAHVKTGSFLASPRSPRTSRSISRAESAGSTIGPYKLLEQIGEGGMGTVYMAEQTSRSAARWR